MSSNTRVSYCRHSSQIKSGDDDSNVSPVKSERNLLAAILARAISDLYGSAYTDPQTIRSADIWLNPLTIDIQEPFSFGWVATHLDLDPHILRSKLNEYHKTPELMEKCLSFLR